MNRAWAEVPLGSLCTFQNGGTPSRAVPEYFEGEIPWLTGADITGPVASVGRSFISEAGVRSSAAPIVPPGTILLVTRTGVGKVAVAAQTLSFSQDITGLHPDEAKVDTGYLVHFLRTQAATLNRKARGATIRGITREVVVTTLVPLPSIEDQRRIAAILADADALRTRRRSSMELVESLTEATFRTMFGDPVTNTREWPLLPFSEVCPTRLGKMLDQKQQSGRHVRPYLRNANVRWFDFDLKDIAEMDFGPADRAEFRVERGDLLICEGGEPGRAAVWDGRVEEIYFQKALHRGRPDPTKATATYLAHLLRHLARRGGLVDYISSATIAHLTGARLKSMRIPVPDLAAQHRFSERLIEVDRLRVLCGRSASELDELFSSLQHRAFAGQL